MRKVLFLIHDLGAGGAEKVLVNLVNNMDKTEFDVTVMSLFGGGINEQYLSHEIKYKTVFPRMIRANSKWMKLFSPEQLHRMFIKENYDIEISFLEGPSVRVICGCQNKRTKLLSWIHVEQHTESKLAKSFRNYKEAIKCYNRFDQIVCVSEDVKRDFISILNYTKEIKVLINPINSIDIQNRSKEEQSIILNDGQFKIIAIGTLKKSKGYDRLLRIVKRLYEEYHKIHLYILGEGPQKKELISFISQNEMDGYVSLLGYQTNPYKYMTKCNLFVCASFAEGLSTATIEALILGLPVCTVEVSGMKQLLGDNKYGIITDNSEEGLYSGIKSLIENPSLLKKFEIRSKERGKSFDIKNTVKDVEKMLLEL